MWFDTPLLDDIDDEIKSSCCRTIQDNKGTYVTICNSKYGHR